MKTFKLVVVSVVLALFTGCVRTLPVNNPSFQVMKSPPATVHKAILKSLQDRRWALLSDRPGEIQARYSRSEHSATILITHTADKVTIKLKDSNGLLQGTNEQGDPVIHKSYNSWINNLENDIQVNLSYLNSSGGK